MYALNHFRFYLLGKKFLVRTDHKALQWLTKTKNPKTPHLYCRWQSLLTEFDFEIHYVPAGQLKLVDALSRKPYKDGDNRNIILLLPKCDKLWDDKFPVADARRTTDDEFWIEVMKKKFGEPIKKTPKEKTNKTRAVGYCGVDSLSEMLAGISLDVSALEDDSEVSTSTNNDKEGFRYERKKVKAYHLTQPRPNQDEYAIYAPKTFQVTNRDTRVVDTHSEVTIPEGTHANVVTPPHGIF